MTDTMTLEVRDTDAKEQEAWNLAYDWETAIREMRGEDNE